MRDLDRRDWLRLGALGLGGTLAGNLTARLGAMLNVGALPATSTDCAIIIFLRGGMDGVHTVVPVGDPTWPAQRTGILPAGTVPLRGTTFMALNQDMSVLAADPASPDARGHAAWINQCGNPNGTKSHFDDQDTIEMGYALSAGSGTKEGFIPRLAEAAQFSPTLPAASVSRRMQLLCRSTNGNRPLAAHIKSFAAYNVGSHDNLPGFVPVPGLQDRLREGMAAHLVQVPESALAGFVDRTGEFMLASEQLVTLLAGYTHDGSKFPRTSSEAAASGLQPLPQGYQFMQECEEALQLIVNSPCRVACVEIGGWDTHAAQLPTRAALDPWLAKAIRSLYDGTVGLEKVVTILVVTEFGRTNMANNAAGTDHGFADLTMAFGRVVNGGDYNSYPSGGSGLGVASWNNLGNPRSAPYQNSLEVATDFRTVFAELLQKRFGLGPEQLNFIIPGWAALAGSGPQYTYLNYLN